MTTIDIYGATDVERTVGLPSEWSDFLHPSDVAKGCNECGDAVERYDDEGTPWCHPCYHARGGEGNETQPIIDALERYGDDDQAPDDDLGLISPYDDEDTIALRHAINEAPGYDEFLRRQEREDDRARERKNETPPHPWGHRLDADGYFCATCWGSGHETGYHPDDIPPCDPLPRHHDIG